MLNPHDSYCSNFFSPVLFVGMENGQSQSFEFENGRRYHGLRAGAYMYPNDEKEQDRLDIFHKVFLVARKGELHCPRIPLLPPPASGHNVTWDRPRILDLGTGTGIWAIEMADKYQDAEIIGMDLSLIQPQRIPQNVRFVIADFESEWALGRNSFNMIHLRVGIGSVSSWPNLFQRVFQHLKPREGWFEYVDIDMESRSHDESFNPSTALYQWQQHLIHATNLVGKPLKYERCVRELLEDAGFVDIHETVLTLPMNSWPTDPYLKDCGSWFNLGMIQGLDGFSLGPLCRVLRWPMEQVETFLGRVKRDINSRNIRSYNTLHVWVARRP